MCRHGECNELGVKGPTHNLGKLWAPRCCRNRYQMQWDTKEDTPMCLPGSHRAGTTGKQVRHSTQVENFRGTKRGVGGGGQQSSA